MNLVNYEKVQANSGGDQNMALEFLSMGLERINSSLTEMVSMVEARDWDGLSRAIHKLRPMLIYAGIETFNEELIDLEKDAREQTEVAGLPARIDKMAGKLKLARGDLEQMIADLSK